jgi:GDP-L-fucose synthase
MNNYEESEHINVGTAEELPIRELAALISRIVGYEGATEWDSTKPDGTPRKIMDVSRIHALGWRHKIELEEGIQKVYADANKSDW